MKFLTKNDFIATFCKATTTNLTSLQHMFDTDIQTFNHKNKTTFLYISKELKICSTTLNKKEVKRLGLKRIKLIDGFWYLKSELKD
jgi:hypothetical protein